MSNEQPTVCVRCGEPVPVHECKAERCERQEAYLRGARGMTAFVHCTCSRCVAGGERALAGMFAAIDAEEKAKREVSK